MSTTRWPTTILRLPGLAQEAWWPIYDALAAYVAAYTFNLTEATRWARDRVVANGVAVNRKAVTLVVQGASYGGHPLYSQPPPTAEEIREAFVMNVPGRAAAADFEVSGDDVEALTAWFGSNGTEPGSQPEPAPDPAL